MELHDHITQAIDRAGIPISELSRRLNVSRQAIYRWISGESVPRSDHLSALLHEVQAPEAMRLAALDAAAGLEVGP